MGCYRGLRAERDGNIAASAPVTALPGVSEKTDKTSAFAAVTSLADRGDAVLSFGSAVCGYRGVVIDRNGSGTSAVAAVVAMRIN
jgi:hypothetical protein